MTDAQRRFARFKNLLLGDAFLRDTPVFADILGDVDFMFWRDIQEKAPYVNAAVGIKLSDRTKGEIILERLEREPSPKRMAELLLAVYDTMTYFSGTPGNLGDDMWNRYAGQLMSITRASGFTDMHVAWEKKPEETYTSDPTHERYLLPGVLTVRYDGTDWNAEESFKLLDSGFASKVLERALSSPQMQTQPRRPWRRRQRIWWWLKQHKRWALFGIGLVLLVVIYGVPSFRPLITTPFGQLEF